MGPYSGPRLDKRCILRCTAQGKLQGGPTADLLVAFALLLYGEKFGLTQGRPSMDGFFPDLLSTCCASTPAVAASVINELPVGTKQLFQLERGSETGEVFVVTL